MACCAPAPDPLFAVALSHQLAVGSSILASQLRMWAGTAAFRPARRQPEQPLLLYDMENCPYCRLVREVLTEFDLDAEIRPCPKRGTRFRPEVKKRGGKHQFPYLVDPNTGTELYESADIIEYLARTYEGRVPSPRGLRRALAVATSNLASAPRPARGLRAKPSKAPAQPLELYSFESSPYSRLVREVLCEMEIPYLLRNTGKGAWSDMGPASFRDRLFKARKDTGRSRMRLLELTGRVQVPYLVDPNTGRAMYESADIIRYLHETYGA